MCVYPLCISNCLYPAQTQKQHHSASLRQQQPHTRQPAAPDVTHDKPRTEAAQGPVWACNSDRRGQGSSVQRGGPRSGSAARRPRCAWHAQSVCAANPGHQRPWLRPASLGIHSLVARTLQSTSGRPQHVVLAARQAGQEGGSPLAAGIQCPRGSAAIQQRCRCASRTRHGARSARPWPWQQRATGPRPRFCARQRQGEGSSRRATPR